MRALSYSSFLLRNEQSVLGILWYLLDPIALFLIIFSIFNTSEGARITHYAVYLFSGLIIYNFFSTVIVEAPGLIRGYRHLLTGMRLSIPVLSISLVLRQLYAHMFEVILLIVLMYINDISLFGILWYLSLTVCMSLFLIANVYSLSIMGALIADTTNVVRFALQILFIGTPIFYADIIPRSIAFINPLYPFLTLSRTLLFSSRENIVPLLVHTSLLIFTSLCVAGSFYYFLNSRAIEYV